ncbi:unnamed protein product [Dracunculus medinensis]|uniref:Endonuclease n=1 Tax=Dracunculus medinensis TaxID=318479 RepID=A0A0N4U661_DRAME|nr:unnamed protein product [Dracunculus medinensis]
MWAKYWRYGSYVGAVVTSFTAGIYCEKWNIGKVNAATATTLPAMPDLPTPAPQTDTKVLPSRTAEIMQYGYPGFDNLRTFEDFVLSYDHFLYRTAHWVVEHLRPDKMVYHPSIDRSKSNFHEDASIHPYFRSTNDDYKGSGYDRGHLAAAGNHRTSQTSIDQTFVLSNMSPQVGKGFNRDKWNELEKRVRKLARKNLNVFVCTGPLYLPRLESDGSMYIKYKVIGKNNVAVPTHFFKVILIEFTKGQYDIEAYVMPNSAIPDSIELSTFLTPVNSIERSAGFHIFNKLPKSSLRYVNGKKAGSVW